MKVYKTLDKVATAYKILANALKESVKNTTKASKMVKMNLANLSHNLKANV